MTPEQRIEYLEHYLAQARHEATELRKRLSESSRHARRVTLAYDHAMLLACWRAGGIMPSRAFAKLHGISQRHWQNANGLLRVARVLDRHRHWLTTDLSIIEPRLIKARQYSIEHPAAYAERLNKHARNK